MGAITPPHLSLCQSVRGVIVVHVYGVIERERRAGAPDRAPAGAVAQLGSGSTAILATSLSSLLNFVAAAVGREFLWQHVPSDGKGGGQLFSLARVPHGPCVVRGMLESSMPPRCLSAIRRRSGAGPGDSQGSLFVTSGRQWDVLCPRPQQPALNTL